MKAAIFAASIVSAAAQDPAGGWLGYAQALPPVPGTRLTYMAAKWKVLSNPRDSSSFYSPWFGCDTSDNLNLLQPVNPWFGSPPWVIYNEYYQWSPSHNQNSAQHNVNPGDELFGSITYVPSTNSYDVYHNSSDGWQVTMNIPIQKKNGAFKNYSIGYFVFEKDAPCADYPPDEIVTFYDVVIQWDGVSQPATWTEAYVDDVCNMRAQVPNPSTSNGTVTITWSTTGADPKPEQIAASQTDRLFGRTPSIVRERQRALGY